MKCISIEVKFLLSYCILPVLTTWTEYLSEEKETFTNENPIFSQKITDDVVYKYHHIHEVIFYQHGFVLQHSPYELFTSEIAVF